MGRRWTSLMALPESGGISTGRLRKCLEAIETGLQDTRAGNFKVSDSARSMAVALRANDPRNRHPTPSGFGRVASNANH